jgi:hypothetical protein
MIFEAASFHFGSASFVFTCCWVFPEDAY